MKHTQEELEVIVASGKKVKMKAAKQELKDTDLSNIKSVSALRKRMALIEIALGFK